MYYVTSSLVTVHFLYNTIQYNADFYSAVSRKRIGGAWQQTLDRLCGSVCRGKELRL